MLIPQRLRNRLEAAITWRVDERVGQRLDELGRGVEDAHGRLEHVARQADWTANEMARITPQVAALEERLERLSRSLHPVVATTEEQAKAVAVLEEVRAEHARIRARLSATSSYEERLRRLEERNC